MSWSIGHDSRFNRDIGYGVVAYCDHPDCDEKIDRGLAHVCGGEPYGGEHGCGLYFCSKHQYTSPHQLCQACGKSKPHFPPKPEHPDWIKHKLTDESWKEWRDEKPDEVEVLKGVVAV